MAINRRRPPAAAVAAPAADPLADVTPTNNPLAGLGLGNLPTPTVSTDAPTPAPNPLAGLGMSTLTTAPPTPVAGLDALKGSVDAQVVKASLGLTGGVGPDPIVLQALQDIQVKLGKLDLSELATKVQIQQLFKLHEASQALTIVMEKTITAMGDVLKEVHTMLKEATAEEAHEAADTPKTVVASANSAPKKHEPSSLSIDIITALVPMLQEQRKAVPQFALSWKAQAATVFPALAQAVSQKLNKEVSAGAVEFAFRELGKLDEVSGLIVF